MSLSAAMARILVATFVVAGCAPSGDSIPPLAAAALRAAAVAAPTPGLLYLRSDTVAYAADASPAGIAGASLALGSSSATTDSSGQFAIQGPAQAGADPVSLRAYADGFVPMRYPWMASEAASTARLGTYAQTASHPRPGFVAGIVPHDMGGWLQPTYEAGMFPSTFDRIRDVAGGNTVVFDDAAWVTAYNAAAGTVTIGTGPATGGFGMASRAMYEDIVAMAHSRGLQFMMLLAVEPDASVGGAALAVATSNTAYWNAFFDAWAVILAERATIARDLGIEHIVLGHSLGHLWQLGPTQWQKAINAVRATGYTGKISTFISVSPYYRMNPYATTTFADGTSDRAAFMGLFDAIGINFVDVIWRTSFSEQLSPAQTRSRMRADVKTILDDLQVSPVPVMVMLGTPSVHGGASAPEFIEPCLPCNSLAPSRTRDYLQQADVYQAVAEVIDAQPPGNGHVMGLLSWGYHYRDDFSWGLNPGDSAYDKSASIRGKPAEAVVHWWFRNWTRSDRDRVFDWAESVYSQFFPAPSAAGNYSQYSFRYYSLTGNYLAEGGGQVIIHNGVSWNFLDVGPLSNFIGPAKTAGF